MRRRHRACTTYASHASSSCETSGWPPSSLARHSRYAVARRQQETPAHGTRCDLDHEPAETKRDVRLIKRFSQHNSRSRRRRAPSVRLPPDRDLVAVGIDEVSEPACGILLCRNRHDALSLEHLRAGFVVVDRERYRYAGRALLRPARLLGVNAEDERARRLVELSVIAAMILLRLDSKGGVPIGEDLRVLA